MSNQLMTMREFAELMRVHINTIANWKKLGMPTITFGATVRIDAYEALAWLKNRADIDDGNLGEGAKNNGKRKGGR